MMKATRPIRADDGSRAERARPLPRRIADHILAQIFLGELRPGDRLPPDRVLAGQLGVDRTSLRAVLSELAGRNIVRAVQGSGVVVLDFHEHAGLDFLDAVFAMPDIDLGSAFNLELLDHWIDVVPAIVEKALGRAKHADLARIDRLFAGQLELLERSASLRDLAVAEVKIQDEVVNLAGSMILRMFANSMRRLRIEFAASFFRYVDVKEHVLTQRDWMGAFMAGRVKPGETAAALRAYLIDRTTGQRGRLSKLASNPTRRGRRHVKGPAGRLDG